MDALICEEADVLRMANAAAVDLTIPRWQPRYRVLPLDEVLVVIEDRTRRLGRMRWGWQRGDAASRGALVTEVRAGDAPGRCVRAFVRGRCLVIATGFIVRAAPMIASALPRVIAARCGLMALAALWKVEGTSDNASAGVVVLTTRAHESLSASMQRMPAIIPFEDVDAWLSTETSHLHLRKLLQPYWTQRGELYELKPTALDARRPGGVAEILEPFVSQ